MTKLKTEIAKLIIQSNETQELLEANKVHKLKVRGLEKLKKEIAASAEGVSDETHAFLKSQISDFNKHINSLNKNHKTLTFEEHEKRSDYVVDKYLELSKENLAHDVLFDFTSTYPGGTHTFKNIIKKLNKEENANIEIVYENHKGRNTQDSFGGYDTKFVVVMPSASYERFNDEIHVVQESSRYDVIGERRDYLFINHLNLDVDLKKIKEDVAESMSENGNPAFGLNKMIGMGYVELMGTNYESKAKVERAINTYFSQIKAMEGEGKRNGVYHETTDNIMTSSMLYSGDIPELEGKILTPLKEALRFLPEQKLKVKNDNKQKNKTQSKIV